MSSEETGFRAPVEPPFRKGRYRPTRRLYKLAEFFGLNIHGDATDQNVEIELGRAGLLLVVISLFDWLAWFLLINTMVQSGVKLSLWTPFCLFMATIFTTATVVFEIRIMTMPKASIRANYGTYISRIALIFVAALATSQPMELAFFDGPIQQRAHEESVIRFSLDVDQRIRNDEADLMDKRRRADSAKARAVAAAFGATEAAEGSGTGEAKRGKVSAGSRGGLALAKQESFEEQRLRAERDVKRAEALKVAAGAHQGCPLVRPSCGGKMPRSRAQAKAIGGSCARTYAAYANSRGRDGAEDKLVEELHSSWKAYAESVCEEKGSARYDAGQCAGVADILERSGEEGSLRSGNCSKSSYGSLVADAAKVADAAMAQHGVLVEQAQRESDKAENKVSAISTEAETAGSKEQAELNALGGKVGAQINTMKQVVPALNRARPSRYELCGPHGELKIRCGGEGPFAALSMPYEPREYDFMERLRVLSDLREGQPARWPGMSDASRERLKQFGLDESYAETPRIQAQLAADSRRYWGTYISVFLLALFIPFVVLVYKLGAPAALQRYFAGRDGEV